LCAHSGDDDVAAAPSAAENLAPILPLPVVSNFKLPALQSSLPSGQATPSSIVPPFTSPSPPGPRDGAARGSRDGGGGARGGGILAGTATDRGRFDRGCGHCRGVPPGGGPGRRARREPRRSGAPARQVRGRGAAGGGGRGGGRGGAGDQDRRLAALRRRARGARPRRPRPSGRLISSCRCGALLRFNTYTRHAIPLLSFVFVLKYTSVTFAWL
jgi:hypothetical protein